MSDKRTVLEIKNLYKIFGSDPQAALELVRNEGLGKRELMDRTGHVLGLNDINTEVREGEITVMMGLSGSGKSTLIRHFNRLIEPTAGEILLDGENVMSLSDDELREMRREKMSMVFQNFALLPHRTVLENTALAAATRGDTREDYENTARAWLERVGLDGNADQYPHELSGGMQQRVGLARALASDAPVMLMDEAFSALDPLIRTDMQDLLLELQSELKKTVVFISHDLDEALKLADHLVILKDGYVVQQGEPQQILLEPNDDYIVDFISDINRARVLRARSVMDETAGVQPEGALKIDHEDTLESVLSKSNGAMDAKFSVIRDGEPVGVLDMEEVLKALVPAEASENGLRAKAS